MAEVLFARRAEKDLKRLDPAVGRRLLLKIRAYSDDPLRHARKLTDSKLGSFRWRIGDFRVIFDFEEDTVFVLRVGDRKDIYS